MSEDEAVIDRHTGVCVTKGLKEIKGHCNSCHIKHEKDYMIVYEIAIGQLTFRLCPFCVMDLKNRIIDIMQRGVI